MVPMEKLCMSSSLISPNPLQVDKDTKDEPGIGPVCSIKSSRRDQLGFLQSKMISIRPNSQGGHKGETSKMGALRNQMVSVSTRSLS